MLLVALETFCLEIIAIDSYKEFLMKRHLFQFLVFVVDLEDVRWHASDECWQIQQFFLKISLERGFVSWQTDDELVKFWRRWSAHIKYRSVHS